jgi:hypothetical protein
MLIPLVLTVFACVLVPLIAIHALCRPDLHSSIHFIALLALTPFVLFAVIVLRRHL